MNDRQKFHETFDALTAPERVLQNALARADACPPHPRQRAVRLTVIAACLAALLTITILADAPDALVNHSNAQQVFQREWRSLKDLNAFVPEIDPTQWTFWQEDQTDHFLFFHWEVDPTFYFTNKSEDYRAHAGLDPDSGKITSFSLEAYHTLAQPDWVPVKSFTNTFTPEPASLWETFTNWVEVNLFGKGSPPSQSITFNYYDHFEVLFDMDMTAGEFGEIWKEYAGYDSFEVLGMDPDMTIYNDLAQLDDEVYFAFRKTIGLQPTYMRLHYLSTSIGLYMEWGEIQEEDLPEDITVYGFQYGYLLRVCNQELDALRDLGVFALDLGFDANDHAPNNPNTDGSVRTNWETRQANEPSIFIRLNPLTHQILHLSVSACDPILPADMTLGELCELWTEYDKMFTRYELPEGAADTPVTKVDSLPDWTSSIEGTYYPIRFYEQDADVPTIRYLYYATAFDGEMYFSFGSGHPVG